MTRYDGRVTPLVDTHAHLHLPEFAEDLDAVLGRARPAGIVAIVTIGADGAEGPTPVSQGGLQVS